jgi:hypothetical protein
MIRNKVSLVGLRKHIRSTSVQVNI